MGRQIADVERDNLCEVGVETVLADFDVFWKSLKTPEQAELLQLLVVGVEFEAGGNSIAIEFRTTGIKGLV
ncbi:hypothetical protein [Symmachiella dynata]|uniref:hypothetical protein n=1 Tax=Symmachiella dynata TaxID=2527995 RepID=UPI0030EB3FDB